jgi:ubiquinone/menaquinone biosynthesis C-methylase UbiE
MTENFAGKGDEGILRKKSAPYVSLAPIYEHVMRHVNYRQWAHYIDRVIKKLNFNSKVSLDIGCGTGNFIYEMHQLGYHINGCDPSEEMLQIARSKNPESTFWQDELPQLPQSGENSFQLVTCMYDTMNYLPTLDIFTEALNRIYQLLKPEGYFIFDVVSEKFCQMYFHHSDEEEVVNENYAYSRKSYYNKATSQQYNYFTIFTPQGIYEEEHVQKIYSFTRIKKMIRLQTPFHFEVAYEDFTFYDAGTNSDRIHFILKKPKV